MSALVVYEKGKRRLRILPFGTFLAPSLTAGPCITQWIRTTCSGVSRTSRQSSLA